MLLQEGKSLEREGPGRQSKLGGDPGPRVGLPAAARELPDQLMCLWEIDLGETGMAVIFSTGHEK